MTPRKRPEPDRGPVTAIEVSPVHDDGGLTYVTTPERATLWSSYTRHPGFAFVLDDYASRTTALIRAREAATERGVPLIYRDARMVHDITDPTGPGRRRPPVPGSFTVELGVCDPVLHALDGCGEADTVLSVDGFPRLVVAVAFSRLVTGLSVIEAMCVARFHGYVPGDMTTDALVAENPQTVTDWRVGEYRDPVRDAQLVEADGPVQWVEGGHQGRRHEL